ncbi:MAG: hypothetical protein ACYCU0_02980 [Solirubrobacteraceae bacterium]
MTEDSRKLEWRYRRLLALYPKRFRREREQEILAVLMSGAEHGQERPRATEAFDLARHAIPMRLRQRARIPSDMELRHPGPIVLVRVLVGLWLIILTIVLCQYVTLWGLLLLLPAALHFYLAYRVAMSSERSRDAGRPPSLPGD